MWYEFYNIPYINEGATLLLPAFIVPTTSHLLPSHARQRKLFLPPQPHHFVCCTRITTVVPNVSAFRSPPRVPERKKIFISRPQRDPTTRAERLLPPHYVCVTEREKRACANGVQQIFVSAQYGPGGLHRTRIVFELKRTRAFHRAYPRCALCWTFNISLSQLDLTTVGTPLCRNEGLLVILDISMDDPNDSKNR